MRARIGLSAKSSLKHSFSRASLDDASALAYLRGDDVDAAPPSGEPGDQCLVAHGGRVLGLAKVLKGGRLKNQLPRECVRRDLAF